MVVGNEDLAVLSSQQEVVVIRGSRQPFIPGSAGLVPVLSKEPCRISRNIVVEA